MLESCSNFSCESSGALVRIEVVPLCEIEFMDQDSLSALFRGTCGYSPADAGLPASCIFVLSCDDACVLIEEARHAAW